MKRIVVGVDGSAGSRRALRWAIAEAVRDGATVVAVHAWHIPPPTAGMDGMTIDLQLLVESAHATIDEVVDTAPAEGLAAPVEKVVVEGSPAKALVDASKDADMVVVGSRGHGGFMGLLLGSVSQQVAGHASCPVVIVPSRAHED